MKANQGTLITGKSGFGKSWMEGYLVEQIDADKPRIILDPKNEHRDLAKSFLLLDRPTFQAAKRIGAKAFWQRCIDKWPSLRVQFTGITLEEGQYLVGELAMVIHERGGITFVAGEYHRYAPNRGAGLGDTPPGLQILHTDARTAGIDWIVSTQRPALMNTTIVSQPNYRMTFNVDDPNDVKRIAPYFDAQDGVPARDLIPRLEKFECIIKDCNTGNQQRLKTTSLTRRIKHHG